MWWAKEFKEKELVAKDIILILHEDFKNKVRAWKLMGLIVGQV